jgi:SAM-dependent methyltransferase
VTDTVRHPIFARAFHRITPLMEREIGPRRDELLAGLSGQVVEVGAGNGANFAHYPDTVGEVIAFEPESYLRRNAARVAPSARVPVQVREGIAEDIPLEDESADAAVVSVVLCTVTDPRRAAAELRRVLKPGGELRFLDTSAPRTRARHGCSGRSTARAYGPVSLAAATAAVTRSPRCKLPACGSSGPAASTSARPGCTPTRTCSGGHERRGDSAATRPFSPAPAPSRLCGADGRGRSSGAGAQRVRGTQMGGRVR